MVHLTSSFEGYHGPNSCSSGFHSLPVVHVACVFCIAVSRMLVAHILSVTGSCWRYRSRQCFKVPKIPLCRRTRLWYSAWVASRGPWPPTPTLHFLNSCFAFSSYSDSFRCLRSMYRLPPYSSLVFILQLKCHFCRVKVRPFLVDCRINSLTSILINRIGTRRVAYSASSFKTGRRADVFLLVCAWVVSKGPWPPTPTLRFLDIFIILVTSGKTCFHHSQMPTKNPWIWFLSLLFYVCFLKDTSLTFPKPFQSLSCVLKDYVMRLIKDP